MAKKVLIAGGMALLVAVVGGALVCAQQAGDEGWIVLFNGKDKTGWKMRDPKAKDNWTVVDGVLDNTAAGSDIVSETTMTDFELHIEFNVDKGHNSGVYLQGRYEIQIDDAFGANPGNGRCGAIYSKIAPSENASKPAGEWQTFDVVFHQAKLDAEGKKVQNARVTLLHNDKKVIDDAEINGVTGGALDNKEGTPGPLMLQGDHGPIKYRNIKYKPLAAG